MVWVYPDHDSEPIDYAHVRGQGIMDLEFEGDGKVLFRSKWWWWCLLVSLLGTYDQRVFVFTEKVTSPEVSQHEVTYVSSHKGPSLVATFSNDGMYVWV